MPNRDLHRVAAHSAASPAPASAGRHVVVDQAAPHFFHRDPFGLVRHAAPRRSRRGRAPRRSCLARKRRDVDEQKPALNRRQRLGRNLRRLDLGSSDGLKGVFHVDHTA